MNLHRAARLLVLGFVSSWTAGVSAHALPCAPPLLQAPPAAAAPSKDAPVFLDLKGDIDGGLRWLRYAQDRESGGYGPDVETTAIVLRALILSPRKYQKIDGPFVERALAFLVARQAADGSIHDAARTQKADITRATSLAAAALALHTDEATQPNVVRALAFLEAQGHTAAPWADEGLPEAKPELRAKAQALLAKRDKDGSWDGTQGRVRATAEAVMWLVRAEPALRAPQPGSTAAKPLPAFELADRDKATKAAARGAEFLASKADKGRFGEPGKADPGLTAMAVSALLEIPEPRTKAVQDAIDQGLAWLVTLQRPDGSIHDGKLANYTTSAAIMALAKAKKPEFAAPILKARDWLVVLQVGPEESYSEDHPYYGGIGYGSSERPDLSNLQMALEALSASGLPQDHEAYQRALKFLSRCQNRSESNDVLIPEGTKTISSGNDGGSAYAPGQSFAGFVETADGKKYPRSYGSMTYALLKGYVLAGLPKDDPRMKAAWDWLQKNYTLDVNPGFEMSADPTAAYQGLYYYFHALSKALALYGADTLTDAAGKQHAWRKELAGRIVAMQRKDDGSWTNDNSPRWWEGNPILATSYALLCLGDSLRQ